MKPLLLISTSLKKFSKGMFGLFLIYLGIFGVTSILNSCKKEPSISSNEAAKTFLQSLKLSKKSLSSVQMSGHSASDKKIALVRDPQDPPVETVYVNFPNGNNTNYSVYQISSVQQLSNLIDDTDAIIQYNPNSQNQNNQVSFPIEEINSSLLPLISNAKQYLYTKGFSERQIQNMIVSEHGTEQDLIPFVTTLANIEGNQQVASNKVKINFSDFFASSAYAKLNGNDYIRCALVAIGADVLFALGSSSAATWTVAIMSRAFSAVAKRFLGPIGVAIAVVSFGVCIGEAYYE